MRTINPLQAKVGDFIYYWTNEELLGVIIEPVDFKTPPMYDSSLFLGEKIYTRLNISIWNNLPKLQEFTDLKGVVFNKTGKWEMMQFNYLKNGVLTISLSIRKEATSMINNNLFMKVL